MLLFTAYYIWLQVNLLVQDLVLWLLKQKVMKTANSVSLAIQNYEVLATELRYKTCLEMILNRDYYIGVHCESNLRFVVDLLMTLLLFVQRIFPFQLRTPFKLLQL